ncbi:MAG: T9SS type A sorting domain-containing protein [Candidatus Kapabacteria bacterium]|nr:T9SS type A sorting domain-containing protein [Candidatus Kapabacteria bacterium]
MNLNLFKVIRKIFYISLILILIGTAESKSQENFDSKGKDFWLTFLPNYHNNKFSSSEQRRYGDSLYIFITSETPTRGIIEYRDINKRNYTHNFTITNPAEVYTFKVSFYDIELVGQNDSGNEDLFQDQSQTVVKQSFHITSDDDITVYALNQAVTTSDAFLVLPTDVLGKNYFVMAYNSDGSNFLQKISWTPSQFGIVATEDNTDVQIIPSSPTHKTQMNIQNIKLNKGDVYFVQSLIRENNPYNDLTGTEIISSNPVAVFSGHQRAKIPYNLVGESFSRDCIIEQLPPVKVWGKNALLVPYSQPTGITLQGSDLFRILAAYDSTQIFINGGLITTLNRGEFYEGELRNSGSVTATNPVLVAQFKKTSADAPQLKLSDPFMMIIPPKEQFLKSCRVINAQAYELSSEMTYDKVYLEHYIIIVSQDNFIQTVKLDNQPVPVSAFMPISGSGYSYANMRVDEGVHTIQSDEPVGVYVYGYGYANSYGYIGGMGFKPNEYQPPEITAVDSCYKVSGVASSYTGNDSGLGEVKSENENNVTVTIENFKPYKKNVAFSARLNDIRQDGYFKITAVDSTGLSTTKEFYIPGFTVALIGNEMTDTLRVFQYNLKKGDVICFTVPVKNYGTKFVHTINSYFFNKPGFTITSNNKVLFPNDVDSIKICYTASSDDALIDTLVINSYCGNRNILIVRINSSRCDPREFNYSDFSNPQRIFFAGSSKLSDKYLRLTPAAVNQSGAVWYTTKVPVKSGFYTKFKFRFTEGNNNNCNDGSLPGADGIAFVIQNTSPMISGGLGGGIGYDGLENSIAIEFDTFSNDSTQIENLFDPNGNHIAIQSRGKLANSSRHTKENTLALLKNVISIRADGTIYYAMIDYNIERNKIRVFLDTVDIMTKPILVAENVKLEELLNLENGTNAWVGFTSATGCAFENHDILSWYLCPAKEGQTLDLDEKQISDFNNFELECSPNPFYDKIKISYYVPNLSHLSISIFDALGREVSSLHNDIQTSGYHNIYWSPETNIQSGIYFLKLKSGNNILTEKLIYLR